MWSVVEYDVCMVCVTFAECAKFVECVEPVERVPRYVDYYICLACVNFPSSVLPKLDARGGFDRPNDH